MGNIKTQMITDKKGEEDEYENGKTKKKLQKE